jgi:hypothetical protein
MNTVIGWSTHIIVLRRRFCLGARARDAVVLSRGDMPVDGLSGGPFYYNIGSYTAYRRMLYVTLCNLFNVCCT